METASQIREHGRGFVIGMRGDVEDARGYSGVLYDLNRFRESDAGSWRGSKLGGGAGSEDGDK
jgi:hypothetical protein